MIILINDVYPYTNDSKNYIMQLLILRQTFVSPRPVTLRD